MEAREITDAASILGSVALSACRCREALGTVKVERVQVVRYRPATRVWEAALELRPEV